MDVYHQIKKFWNDAGMTELDADGLKPTARDPYLQQLNEHYIREHLQGRNYKRILDVGCGEGSSSLIFAAEVEQLIGIDYSESLISQASSKRVSNTEFIHADVLNLQHMFEESSFDALISIRCLINLPSEEMQYAALDSMFAILKPGGLMFFSEGYENGWNGINVQRQRNGLPVMDIVSYNKLFNELELERFLNQKGKIKEFIGFGDYLYGSRILHPLICDNNVRHDSPINRVFSEVQINNPGRARYADCDYAGIYVVEKL